MGKELMFVVAMMSVKMRPLKRLACIELVKISECLEIFSSAVG